MVWPIGLQFLNHSHCPVVFLLPGHRPLGYWLLHRHLRALWCFAIVFLQKGGSFCLQVHLLLFDCKSYQPNSFLASNKARNTCSSVQRRVPGVTFLLSSSELLPLPPGAQYCRVPIHCIHPLDLIRQAPTSRLCPPDPVQQTPLTRSSFRRLHSPGPTHQTLPNRLHYPDPIP